MGVTYAAAELAKICHYERLVHKKHVKCIFCCLCVTGYSRSYYHVIRCMCVTFYTAYISERFIFAGLLYKFVSCHSLL